MLPKVGATLGGKYTLEAVIGRGGMGAVYRAKNQLTGRRVALKWILPSLSDAGEMRTRLLREARAMGRIEHPNVCAVYDVGEDGEAIYLVMELLRGRTLRAMLDERKPRGVEETCRIILSAMQGVAAAHLAGVIHRDLKPDNLFVCEDEAGGRGPTKVLDFGVSKILDSALDEKLTKSGTAVGTPHYMSPEQIVGSREVDHRADVYALGAIVYQCLTGRLPFDAENFSALVVRIAMADPEPFLTHASPEAAPLEAVVLRAIAKRPEDRYPDVTALAVALEPFAGGPRFEPPRAHPRSVPPPAEASATAEPEPVPPSPSHDRSAPSPSVAVTLPAGPLPVTTPSPLPSVAVDLQAAPAAAPGPAATARSRRFSPGALALAGVVIVLVAIGAALASSGGTSPTTDPARQLTPSAASPAAREPEATRPSPAVGTSEATHAGAALEPGRGSMEASAPGAIPSEPPARRAEAAGAVGGPRAPARRGATRGGQPMPEAASTPTGVGDGPRTGSGRSGTLSTDDF